MKRGRRGKGRPFDLDLALVAAEAADGDLPETPCHVVYFVQGTNGLIKIGSTLDLRRRLRSLRAMSATAVVLLGWCIGRESLELTSHEALVAHRAHGEWFRPHADVLAALEMSRTLDEVPFYLAMARRVHTLATQRAAGVRP